MDFFDGFGAGEGIVPGFEELGGEALPVEEPLAHDVTLEPLDITLTKEDEPEKPKETTTDEDNASPEEAAVPLGKRCFVCSLWMGLLGDSQNRLLVCYITEGNLLLP